MKSISKYWKVFTDKHPTLNLCCLIVGWRCAPWTSDGLIDIWSRWDENTPSHSLWHCAAQILSSITAREISFPHSNPLYFRGLTQQSRSAEMALVPDSNWINFICVFTQGKLARLKTRAANFTFSFQWTIIANGIVFPTKDRNAEKKTAKWTSEDEKKK